MSKDSNIDVIVIGAGLTGLATAYHLINQGKKVKVLEARGRVGGRIFTDGYQINKPVEMGATWLGNHHKYLLDFLSSLELETFVQVLGDRAIFESISTSPPDLATLPPNDQPSFRLRGGTENIIRTLVEKIGVNSISTSESVQAITLVNGELEVKSNQSTYTTNKVVSTLPPNLLVNKIQFSPELPIGLTQVASDTHTWMGESIKIGLTYSTPFWREKNTSGTILSNVGPITEMYDHSSYEDTHYALMGFFNGSFYSISKDQRLEMILKQLTKYYGSIASSYIAYHETVWRKEEYTFFPHQTHVLPHQNNGNPIYQKTYLDNHLIIAGSETSPIFPGYMEGAIYSAKIASEMIDQ